MWFSKKIKMSEILLVSAFDVICNSSFDSKCLHHSMHLPYCTDLQERDIKMGVTQTGTTIVKRQKSSQLVSWRDLPCNSRKSFMTSNASMIKPCWQ
jgi:hypothetical protein